MQLTKIENNFTHESFGTLTLITDDNQEVYFISNEISNVLGYSSNKHLLERLDSEEKLHLNYEKAKAVLTGHDLHSSGIQLLTESGFYNAVLGSQKPEAKLFKKWVTGEVLPAIRKTGSYSRISLAEQVVNTYFANCEPAQQALVLGFCNTIEVQKKELEEAAPKVAQYNMTMNADGTFDIAEVAKMIGTGRDRLFEFLRIEQVFFKKGNINQVYQTYINQGYFKMIQTSYSAGDQTNAYAKIVVFPKGVEFITRLYNKKHVTLKINYYQPAQMVA